MEAFGPVVKALRQKTGITVEALAVKVGVQRSYVSMMERQEVKPPAADVIRKIARVLRYSTRTLMLLAYLEKVPPEIVDVIKFALRNGRNGHRKSR